MNYWFIKKWDGSEIRVTPRDDNIQIIKNLLSKGEGHIVTRTHTLAVKDVKEFYESDKPVVDETHVLGSGLDEEAARAFNEPILTASGDVVSRYVKKRVPRRKYDSHYAHHFAYVFLSEDDTGVTVGFALPTHLIDQDRVQFCNDQESFKIKSYLTNN